MPRIAAVAGCVIGALTMCATGVAAHYPIPVRPTASFTFAPAIPTTGQAVRFDASASSDTDGDSIIAYRWTFGDRSSLTTTTPVVTHAYAKPGVKIVRLTVLDSKGTRSEPTAHAIQIAIPPPPAVTSLHVKVCARRSRRCPRRGLRLRFTLNEPAALVLTVRRRFHERVLKRVVIFAGHAGINRDRIRFRGRRGRHYVLRVRPVGGLPVSRQFVWRRR